MGYPVLVTCNVTVHSLSSNSSAKGRGIPTGLAISTPPPCGERAGRESLWQVRGLE